MLIVPYCKDLCDQYFFITVKWLRDLSHYGFMIITYRHSRLNQRAARLRKATDRPQLIFCNGMAAVDPFRKQCQLTVRIIC